MHNCPVLNCVIDWKQQKLITNSFAPKYANFMSGLFSLQNLFYPYMKKFWVKLGLGTEKRKRNKEFRFGFKVSGIKPSVLYTLRIRYVILNKYCVYLVTQSCLTLCHPLDCSPPDSTVHGTFQARTLEWVAISFCRGSSQPRDQTQVSCVSYIASRFFTYWAIGKAINKHILIKNKVHKTKKKQNFLFAFVGTIRDSNMVRIKIILIGNR